MSDGGFGIFFQRPISAVVLIIAGLLLFSTGFSTYRKTKTKIIVEAGSDDE
jgi:TctA family transporter